MQTRLADDPRKRAVWGTSLVLIAVTVLLGGAPGAATATPLTAPPVPVLSWGPCDGADADDPGDGFECATARVPLDHRRPTGRTIPLPVTRRPAADTAHRTGVLVLHPGGPGNSGVDFARDSYDDTPYQDAVALAGTLDSGRLLTFAGEGHTVYDRSACVSALATDYLAALALPARGTVCSDETPPEPLGRRTTGIEVDETRDAIPTLR
ncbi:alpha/beta hydrolase [Streptomyces sp. NPDC090741]|uniref:alpha/beta hydrolase n=1 Tax=Streptomyces sp. NPDC090741 TaxID=3365967 RepID=UPI0037F2F49D